MDTVLNLGLNDEIVEVRWRYDERREGGAGVISY